MSGMSKVPRQGARLMNRLLPLDVCQLSPFFIDSYNVFLAEDTLASFESFEQGRAFDVLSVGAWVLGVLKYVRRYYE